VPAARNAPAEMNLPRSLPLRPGRTRRGTTYDVQVGGLAGYLTVTHLPDGRPIEVVLALGKQGSTLGGLADALSQMISLALQYRTPLVEVVERLVNMRFEPAGFTTDPDVPMSASIADYLGRRLAADYLSAADNARLGLAASSSPSSR
jgi:ribonucleoside-diphosphate reductase alpha chain